LFFYFYQKNFDNYKLLEKILNKSKEPIKEIELSSGFNTSLTTFKGKNNTNSSEFANFDPLIEKSSTETKLNINNITDINRDSTEISEKEGSFFDLKKLHFYDFFFNNIYFKCCKRIKNQDIIDNINDIIYKYLSIDALLYNQIKLENLFKDYKWNNPLIDSIQKNKMVNKLRNSCLK
jgi:hypothetical protein